MCHADMYLACGHLFRNVGKYSTCRLCFTCAQYFFVVMNFAHMHVVFGGHMHVFALCLTCIWHVLFYIYVYMSNNQTLAL